MALLKLFNANSDNENISKISFTDIAQKESDMLVKELKEVSKSKRIKKISTKSQIMALMESETEESTETEPYEQIVDDEYLVNDSSYNASVPLDTRLMAAATPNVKSAIGKNKELITMASLRNKKVIENKVLNNIYEDAIMGDVILNPLNDCSYRRATERLDVLEAMRAMKSPPEISLNRQTQWVFTWSEGARSLLTNPFKGKDISNGCTMSMWIRVPSFFALTERSALFTFLGDLKYYEFPDPNVLHNIENDVWTTPYLTVDAGLNIAFQEAYQNWYAKELKDSYTTFEPTIPPYRRSLGRKWEHLVFSFTDEGIETYINGTKVDYDIEFKGKRFHGGNGEPGNSGMCKLTEFLSAEDTNLFLGLTILNDTGKCDQIMYKNIRFYDNAANADKALDIFKEEVALFSK